MARFQPLIAAAVGGAIGSLLRWAAVASVDDDVADLVILGLNVAGSLLLGLLLGSGDRFSEGLITLLGTGVAGGLTTFSTFAVAVAARLEDGELLAASGFGIGTFSATLLAAGLGFRTGLWLRPADRHAGGRGRPDRQGPARVRR